VVVAAALLLLLKNLVELLHHHGVHALEDLDDIGGGACHLRLRVRNQSRKFAVNFLCPGRHLVINDVDLLELLLKE
jgi:hypothetical protein